MKILIVITCVVLLSCCTSVLLVDGNEMQGKLSDRAENKVKDGKGMDSMSGSLRKKSPQMSSLLAGKRKIAVAEDDDEKDGENTKVRKTACT